MAANQNRQNGKTYSAWHAVAADTTGLLFDALCEPERRKVRICLLPWIGKDAEARESLRERVNGLQLLNLPSAVEVIEFVSEEKPPRLVCEAIESVALADVARQLTIEQGLDLALELCEALAGLSRFRIDCETTSLDQARVVYSEDGPHWKINYVAKYLTQASFIEARAIEIGDVRKMLSTLIDSQLMTQSPAGFPARLQAILKRLVAERTDDEDLDEYIARAASALHEVIQIVSPRTDTTAISGGPPMVGMGDEAGRQDQTAEIATSQIDLLADNESTRAFDTDDIHHDPKYSMSLKPGDLLGRYRLEKILGEGGMGCVFKAIDITNQNAVAVKVLRGNHADIAQAVRRFKKEARILASVQNQYVTQLYEVGIENGHHFLAMEYVEGIDLKAWLKNRLPMNEREALRLIADIARGLVDAHHQEIVHRDIKPENILLKQIEGGQADGLESYQVKLTDFGIARHVNQSASLEVTRAGTLLGTPAYMSPEQCMATGAIGPAADVYSMGITLYLLLSGELPFVATDALKLAAMHCFDDLPNIQKRNSQISDPAAELLNKMLAKSAEHRFTDAAQLLRAIDRMISGEASDLAMHPRPPEIGTGKLWRRDFEWDLKSSPEELWPLVSNTDRLNRAAGLQAVQYRTIQDEKLGLRKFGSFRLSGIQIEWEEHPFEWVEGHRMGVLREFSSGPFQWFMSSVELTRKSDGGTNLKHSVQILPRNALGRVVSTVEAGWKGFRSLDRIYKRIDESIQNKSNRKTSDPFETAQRLGSVQSKQLEQRTEELIRRGIDVGIAMRLADFVRNASPQSLAHIRPYDLAAQLQVPNSDMLDACLVAADCRLLVLKWDILCPTCRVSAATSDILSNINQHTNCEACDIDFQSNLGEAIELVFQAHPDVRDVDTGKYCIGGPEHAPHVACQLRLQPAERVDVDVPVTAGEYLLRATRLTNQQFVRVRSQAAPSRLDVSLSKLGNAQSNIRAGRVSLSIYNDLSTQQLVRLERIVARRNVVTASAASSLQRFRELFPHQVFRRDVPMVSEDVTLLAVSLTGLDPLYEQLGESEAYVILQRAMADLEKQIVSNSGAVVRTNGEYLLAAFARSADAVKSGLDMLKWIAQDSVLREAWLNIVVHRGQTLVTTQNGRLDYFGAIPRRANELLNLANGRMIVTDAVFSDDVVQKLVNSDGVAIQVGSYQLKDGTRILAQNVSLTQ